MAGDTSENIVPYCNFYNPITEIFLQILLTLPPIVLDEALIGRLISAFYSILIDSGCVYWALLKRCTRSHPGRDAMPRSHKNVSLFNFSHVEASDLTMGVLL